MTQEQKDLLLQDLSARLPYGVKVNVKGVVYDNRSCRLTDIHHRLDTYIEVPDGMQYHIENIKPYLFPLSRITKKQRDFLHANAHGIYVQLLDNTLISASIEGFDWLNKNHFDYRGLIDKGLAIDATGLKVY